MMLLPFTSEESVKIFSNFGLPVVLHRLMKRSDDLVFGFDFFVTSITSYLSKSRLNSSENSCSMPQVSLMYISVTAAPFGNLLKLLASF